MKKLLILLLTLTFTSATFAEKVTKQQALEKAKLFFKDKRLESTTKNLARGSETENLSDATQEDYYVFNAEDNGGFVIISGDDRTPEVLGYSDNGRIDMESLPPNLMGWLEEYSKQMKALDTIESTGTRAHTRALSSTPKIAIEPLITTKWGQGSPYNNQCPEIDGKHCVTGCVATAMAQVMYYHKWPQEACAAIPQYTTITRQIEMPALPSTTFKWSVMRDRYWNGEAAESADAVAELMRYCGQAVSMDYDIGGSGGWVMPREFIQYFGYSKNAKYITMPQYTISQWEDILYKELSEGRPILYGGASKGSAHAFICDGYTENGYYHFNWGWDGASNGYFQLSVLHKDDMGAYVFGQHAIIGLQPGNGGTTIPYFYGYQSENLTQTEFTRFSSSDNFINISLVEGVFIQYEYAEDQDVSIDYGLGLYKDTQLLSVLDQSSAVLNLNSNTVYKQTNVSFGKDLEDGVYQIRPIYRYANNDNWEACIDSYINYIVATISANNLTLRKVSEIDIENATYTINSVTLSGNVLTVNLTNTGNANQQDLHLWIKELGWVNSLLGTFGPGETGEVVFEIQLDSYFDNRDVSFLITADRSRSKIMWEGSFSFPERVEQQLTCSNLSIDNMSFDDDNNGVLVDSELHLTLSLTNTGENIFDDIIYCQLYSQTSDPNISMGFKLSSQSVLLNKGETKNIEFVVSNLENITHYSVACYYYGKNIKIIDNSIFRFIVAKNRIEYGGLTFAYSNNSKMASVIPGDYQNLESITIPRTIAIGGTSYSVTEIAQNAFRGCHIKTVSLPEGLLAINSEAFGWYSSLENINLPSTLLSIGRGAFRGSKLKEVTIPEGVNSIGREAFGGCSELEVLKLPTTLKLIEEGIIHNCGNLNSVYSSMNNPIKVAESTFLCNTTNQPTQIPSATLYVPKGSVSKYQEAEGWNVFTRITDNLPYKLTYYVDGEIYKSYMIEENTGITPEEAPTKEGHAFSDWSEIPETMPAHDVTVTGSFTVNKYKLIYKVDEVNYKTVEVNYSAEITPEEAPTKEGHSFSNWSEIPETMPAHDVTVTGSFVVNKYKLIYKVDNTDYKTVEVNYGAEISPEEAPTKEGYAFSDWSEIPETMPAHDITVTGSFAVNKYKLIYKVDNTDYKTVEVNYGAEISPEEAPTKEGHTFSGWSEIPKTMPAHDVTVTGTFSINKYALTYTVDGDEYKSNEVEYGANITPEAVPTKEGYTFSGWSEIPETMPAHDVTVTGVFYKKGDANGDNTVNAADIVEIVNYIEGNPSEIFNKTAADMNGDKEIDSTDLEGVVNSIMEKE